MKIPLNDILMVYEGIVKDINISQVSMIIFTALDVDALCTLKILSKFLKNENIEYKIYPSSSYSQLQQKIQDCKTYEKVKLFFFINCGGLIDLTTKWIAKNAVIFLFDINKPIHHANIQAVNIKIIDDACSDLQKAPTNQQVQLYQNIDDDLLENMQQKQQQQQDQDQQLDIIARKRKRHRSSQQAMHQLQKIRKIKAQLTQRVQLYYSQQFFGLPSSYIAYKMIKDLNKLNNSYLWYAIVGATSVYLEQKIGREQFQNIGALYRNDLLKYNNKTNNQKYSLKPKVDFQFPLFRHWSIYQSIMNSGYMIAGLGLWDQPGIKKLYELISLIGLSLEQAQQLFKYMVKASIQKLQNKLLVQASRQKFKLLDIAFQSFTKQIDYAFEMSATDYYYVLASILEKPTKKVNINEVFQNRVQCFWNAYEVFGWGQTKLQAGIEDAKKMLLIYTREAKSILQRNQIMNGQTFSFINHHCDTDDRRLFQHPNALTKLAYMLMWMNKQKKKMKHCKPFITSLQNNITQTSQMVGIMNETKNYFSSRFTFVIEKLNIDVRMDSFMSNIMTVPKSAMVDIIRQLGQL